MWRVRTAVIVMNVSSVVFVLLTIALVCNHFISRHGVNAINAEGERKEMPYNWAETLTWGNHQQPKPETESAILERRDDIRDVATDSTIGNQHSKKTLSDSVTSVEFLQPSSLSERDLFFHVPETTVTTLVSTNSTGRPQHRKRFRDPLVSPRFKRANKTKAELAWENLMSIKPNSVRCAEPKPKVVKVQDVHPHAFKRFVPSCIVLHRCDKDSGCCDDAHSVCSPARKRRITKYFYVVSLRNTDGESKVESEGIIDPLRFVNHTACTCKRRTYPPPVDMGRVASHSMTSMVPPSSTLAITATFGLIIFGSAFR